MYILAITNAWKGMKDTECMLFLRRGNGEASSMDLLKLVQQYSVCLVAACV